MVSGLVVRELGVVLSGRRILDDVGLAVPAGGWLSLVGPNGAGKSTLLRAIAGGLPHTGRAEFAGADLARLRRRQRARTVALVPQEPVRPAGMSVLDYVLLGRTPYLPHFGFESAADIAIAQELLATLELAPHAARTVTELSTGEFQRVVLARALAQQAPLLLLDEPTSALDLGHAQQVLDLVDRLRRERELTVVGTLHDLTLAGQFADRVSLLVNGRVAADGRAADVLTEDAIATHYGARVRVLPDGDGGVAVVPTRIGAVAR